MLTIQQALPENAPEIKALLWLNWRETYRHLLTPEQLEKVTGEWHNIEKLTKQITDDKSVFLTVTEGGKLAAICNTGSSTAENLNIQRLHVHPDYQRKGIGTMLLQTMIDRFPGAKTVDLEVEKTNNRAISFYRKMGFREAGTKDFSVLGIIISCWIMKKKLK